jgi:hypothetical protein
VISVAADLRGHEAGCARDPPALRLGLTLAENERYNLFEALDSPGLDARQEPWIDRGRKRGGELAQTRRISRLSFEVVSHGAPELAHGVVVSLLETHEAEADQPPQHDDPISHLRCKTDALSSRRCSASASV